MGQCGILGPPDVFPKRGCLGGGAGFAGRTRRIQKSLRPRLNYVKKTRIDADFVIK